MTSNRRLGLLVFLFALLLPQAALAALGPRFELVPCTGSAKAIVLGTLDEEGFLTVADVLRGRPGSDTLFLRGGADYFRALTAVMGDRERLDVLVFLDVESPQGGWLPAHGAAGVIGFDKNAVYLYLSDAEHGLLSTSGSVLDKHPRHTRASFVEAVRKEAATAAEREKLLSMPRSGERTRRLLAFLQRHAEPTAGDGGYPPGGNYHLVQVSIDLRKPGREEENTVFAALRQSERGSQRVMLLDLMGYIGMSPRAIPEVVPWTERVHPAAIQRSAFWVLNRLDTRKAADLAASRLTLDEPLLLSLLSLRDSAWSSAPKSPVSKSYADSLLILAAELRKVHREGAQAKTQESSAILGQMSYYGHPQFLPLLYEWAAAGDPVSAEQAAKTLESLTGLKLWPHNMAAWHAWWDKARPVLQARYDLHTAAGRAAWLIAHQRSDQAARRLLLNLWSFETDIDEAALLQAATGPQADAAKAVLADLWQRRRLSPTSKQAILRTFVAVRLEELPNPYGMRVPAWRELRIIADRKFPFPRDAWINHTSDCAMDRVPMIRDRSSCSSHSLEGIGPIHLGGMGGSYPGAPQARAVLEVWEAGTESGQVSWRQTWEIGPIQLRRVAEQP